MIKTITQLLVFLIAITCLSPASAKIYSEISTYGIYVAGAKGFVKIEPYHRYDNFVEFAYLNEIPSVERDNDSLRVIVYQKDFNEESIRLEVRPIDTIINIQRLKFEVQPMNKADMYELTLDKPVNNGTMLHVHTSQFEQMGVIMLGNTQAELVKFFSRKDHPNAPVVLQYLEDAIRAYPDNYQLRKIAPYWKKEAETVTDRNDYAYVEEKWLQYEQAEKLELKSRYLTALTVEINGYLNAHPHGYKADEARERLVFAEKRLKEYEKLL